MWQSSQGLHSFNTDFPDVPIQFIAIDGSMLKESNMNLSLSLDFFPIKSKLSLYVTNCIHMHKNMFAAAEVHQ